MKLRDILIGIVFGAIAFGLGLVHAAKTAPQRATQEAQLSIIISCNVDSGYIPAGCVQPQVVATPNVSSQDYLGDQPKSAL